MSWVPRGTERAVAESILPGTAWYRITAFRVPGADVSSCSSVNVADGGREWSGSPREAIAQVIAARTATITPPLEPEVGSLR